MKKILDPLQEYMDAVIALARQTGVILLDYWRGQQDLQIRTKSDGTPSTAADLAAHQNIIAGLQAITPHLPILSEEGQWPDYEERRLWQQYWLVDPLDGTRGFIAHLEQFSINIALIRDHQSVLGVIYVPAADTVYYAWEGGGAYKQIKKEARVRLRFLPRAPETPWRIVVGQYSRGVRLKQLIGDRCPFELLHVNGSVKFGWLAEGQADIYPRLGPIQEWDTAAGQCIVSEAGGAVVDLQGQKLQYNRKPSLLNPEFIALANAEWMQQWLEILHGRSSL